MFWMVTLLEKFPPFPTGLKSILETVGKVENFPISKKKGFSPLKLQKFLNSQNGLHLALVLTDGWDGWDGRALGSKKKHDFREFLE